MNDTPGWASPGSAPSDPPGPPDGREPVVPAEPADRPADAPVPNQGPSPVPDTAPVPGTEDSLAKWSKEQPPPGAWSAPGGPAPGQTPPPPPPPGPGWGGQAPGGQGWGGLGGGPGWGAPGGPGWNAPGGGPGWGGPGPVGPGGYGPGQGWGGWQGRPPAAKPGVIPLRPLGVGEILDGAVSTMRTYWRPVLGISLSVAVVTQLVLVLLQGFVLNDVVDTAALNDQSATLSELVHAMRNTLISSGVVLLITLLGTIIATALLTTVTSRAVLGRPVTISEAWRTARPQVPRLIGLTLLLPLIFIAIVVIGALPGILVAVAGSVDGGTALAGFGGFAGALVSLWLVIRFALASPALMLEKQSVPKSLGRSAKLVKGSWWRVLGIQMLAALIADIVASIILVPFALIAGAVDGSGTDLFGGTGSHGWLYLIISAVGSVIGSTLTFPITAGVSVLLYIDQRIRREALDLELARAAGTQGHGSQAPGAVPGS